MLKVEVSSESRFLGVFETDDPKEAVEQALADLVANHGFFSDNMIHTEFPPAFTPNKGVYGILVMPGDKVNDPDNLADKIDSDSTTWIYVTPLTLNKMFSD